MTVNRISNFIALIGVCVGATSCLQPPGGTSVSTSPVTTDSSSASGESSLPGGARAVKIIFKQELGGSFDASGPGALSAMRLFNPSASATSSGNPIAEQGPGGTGWPSWLKGVVLSSSMSSLPCAGFAGSDENDSVKCDLDGNGTPESRCGAPAGFLRVSEADCRTAPSSAPSIRILLDRDPGKLGAQENLLAVLELTAAAPNPSPADPSTCLSGATFDPSNCMPMVWQSFLRKTAGDSSLPFLMIAPPALAPTLTTLGGGVTTRQIYLPLATQPRITEFTVERASGVPATLQADIDLRCNGAAAAGGGEANSAACAGVIFYSLSIFRI